jgi:cysteine synthase B
MNVSQEEAENMMIRLAREEAIFAGVSSGGGMAAAVRLAHKLDQGVIVTIICDRGDRYLSSNVFEDRLKSRNGTDAKVLENGN